MLNSQSDKTLTQIFLLKKWIFLGHIIYILNKPVGGRVREFYPAKIRTAPFEYATVGNANVWAFPSWIPVQTLWSINGKRDHLRRG